jgi:hypothetical protein
MTPFLQPPQFQIQKTRRKMVDKTKANTVREHRGGGRDRGNYNNFRVSTSFVT